MIQVLFISDSTSDVLHLQTLLIDNDGCDYTLTSVDTVGNAALILKKNDDIDVIIYDTTALDSVALQRFHTLQHANTTVPVIFLVNSPNNYFRDTTQLLGIADYLQKETLDSAILQRSIHYAVEYRKIHDELQRTKANKVKFQKTAKLFEKEVHQLQLLNKTKDDFLSIASHQLRTPATGVKQYLGMVLEGFCGTITSEQRATLEQANSSNERQLKIIDDILQTAHLDSGQVEMKMKQCDIVGLLKRILNEQKDQFKRRKQSIRFTHSASRFLIRADEYHLRMALENIIENASKYTPNEKSIDVDLQSCQYNISIFVKDQGVGMKKTDFDKVFDKFTRVTNSLSGSVGGTGLGLYWSKRIIDLHKGKINLDSKINIGTTFSIKIPINMTLPAKALPH